MFGLAEADYLGHIIIKVCLKADPPKFSAIADWPIPTIIKQ